MVAAGESDRLFVRRLSDANVRADHLQVARRRQAPLGGSFQQGRLVWLADVHNHEALFGSLLNVKVILSVLPLQQHLSSRGLRKWKVCNHRRRKIRGLPGRFIFRRRQRDKSYENGKKGNSTW